MVYCLLLYFTIMEVVVDCLPLYFDIMEVVVGLVLLLVSYFNWFVVGLVVVFAILNVLVVALDLLSFCFMNCIVVCNKTIKVSIKNFDGFGLLFGIFKVYTVYCFELLAGCTEKSFDVFFGIKCCVY